jgi:GNAT superfamily N-acetyltransferase
VDVRNYSQDETLRDGSRIEIRALRPDDRDALLSSVGGMSDESVRRRFFAPKRHFSAAEVAFYVNVDFVSHVALVAVRADSDQSVILGGARYIVTSPGVAEAAFTVDDAHQGRGIGGRLLRHLAAIARARGLRALSAEVLAVNAAMLTVFRNSGLRMDTQREHDVVHVTLHLS